MGGILKIQLSIFGLQVFFRVKTYVLVCLFMKIYFILCLFHVDKKFKSLDSKFKSLHVSLYTRFCIINFSFAEY